MSKAWPLIIGVLVGMAALATWRFFTYTGTGVHYHANFAVYINGERETFSAETYYEETSGCSLDTSASPVERTHMHDHSNDLVHVHASAVTWGQFFQNLGWGIGPTYLQTREKLFVADSKHPLTYVLNGTPTENPAGLIISSEDRLLVSYGTANQAELDTQFNSIASSAAEQNTKQDPASCSGGAKPSWRDRLKSVLR